MLLSTSNSRKPTKADIAFLLVVAAVFCLAVELMTAHFFGRVSHIEKRRETEYRDVLAIRSARQRGRISVLLAGNSLLLHGVDLPGLQRTVGPDLEVHRTVFENTGYLDWYYGLRRIFNVGSRPDVVVLVLSPSQLVSNWTGGDYSVQMLVDRKDLLNFAGDLHADRNRISVLALDNMSYFFGTRAETRSWILGKILPDLQTLTRHFHLSSEASNPLSDDKISQISAQRLQQTSQLCEQYGAVFVFALPPTLQDSGESIVVKTAQAHSLRILLPIEPGGLPRSDYSDLMHLNAGGAAVFTPALADGMKQMLTSKPILSATAPGSSQADRSVVDDFRKAVITRPAEPVSAKAPLGQFH
jgi:hypothetical protein